jgi:Domain of unknown function (DUF6471)
VHVSIARRNLGKKAYCLTRECSRDVGLLRAEMARRGITYQKLADRLVSMGVRDTAVNLRNKVARGRFSALFLVQCLRAIGVRALRLNEDSTQQ